MTGTPPRRIAPAIRLTAILTLASIGGCLLLITAIGLADTTLRHGSATDMVAVSLLGVVTAGLYAACIAIARARP